MCYTIHTRAHVPCLSVSDDELSLSPPDGHKGVHGLDSCHHGLPHRDAGDDAGSLCPHTSTSLGLNGALRSNRRGDTQQEEAKKATLL